MVVSLSSTTWSIATDSSLAGLPAISVSIKIKIVIIIIIQVHIIIIMPWSPIIFNNLIMNNIFYVTSRRVSSMVGAQPRCQDLDIMDIIIVVIKYDIVVIIIVGVVNGLQ